MLLCGELFCHEGTVNALAKIHKAADSCTCGRRHVAVTLSVLEIRHVAKQLGAELASL